MLSSGHLRSKVLKEISLNDIETRDEEILQRIHRARLKKNISSSASDFLYTKFLETKDIRFFNEFLWCNNVENTTKVQTAKTYFQKWRSIDGYYKYPRIEKFDPPADIQFNPDWLKPLKVCLIGNCFHFLHTYRLLKRNGIIPDIIDIGYHPNKTVKVLFYNRLMTLFYSRYFKKSGFSVLRIKKPSDLKEIKLNTRYDLGFHKIPFIIPPGITAQFKKGLINDHWGLLPPIKGRSTILYSKLLGIKPVITNHLIEQTIDSGAILCFTPVKNSRNNRQVALKIYKGFAHRVLKSLSLLAEGKLLTQFDNTKGYMFYEMHPWLKDQVKRMKTAQE